MNRLERLTTIVVLLQQQKVLRANDLAERFDVSKRTIYRDMKVLEEAGVPIMGDAGVGYSIVREYNLPPVHFSLEEANALLIAAKLVESLPDDLVKNHFKSAFEKIRAVMNWPQKLHIEQMEQVVKVLHVWPPNEVHKGYFDLVQKALLESKVLKISYLSSYKNEVSRREVEPIGLTFYSGYWHLIAWCRLRHDYRDFRIDRIERCEAGTETFEKGRRMELDEYLSNLRKNHRVFKVKILIDKEFYPYLANIKYGLGFIAETEREAVYEMEFLTESLHYFAQMVLTWGTRVQLLEPPELIQQVHFMLHELNNYYKIK
ncbi:WYL domain-containing protein [bacterium]|nr:WYL domain-containing protein [bacterium]